MTVTRHLTREQPAQDLSGRTKLFFAVACGAIVANLYYAQPLVALIGPAIGLSEVAASLIVTLSQLGYGLGLLLLVPLGDLFENRRLVVTTLGGTLLALFVVATATTPFVFLAGALLLGVTSVVVQMLVPLAAHLAPEATRGRVIGTVVSGLLFGILLARPLASLVADQFGWRAVFLLSAVLMAALAIALVRMLPQHRPSARLSCRAILTRCGRFCVRHRFYSAEPLIRLPCLAC